MKVLQCKSSLRCGSQYGVGVTLVRGYYRGRYWNFGYLRQAEDSSTSDLDFVPVSKPIGLLKPGDECPRCGSELVLLDGKLHEETSNE